MHRLASLSFDKSRPGFYDDPVFVKAEESDRQLLDAYAKHVLGLKHSTEYLTKARNAVKSVSEFLMVELRKDGRLGACRDLSGVVSRFLEREGVWNFLVKGNVFITFDNQTKLKPYRMETVGADPGHSWLIAPPFKVVDLTIEHQKYRHGEAKYLPAPILSEDASSAVPTAAEVEPEFAEHFAANYRRAPSLEDLREIAPVMVDRVGWLGAQIVRLPKATLKYVAHSVTAPDAPLEEVTNLVLSKRYPKELWAAYEAAKASAP